ncbi:hemophore-related protein [Mycolicibacterium elephantis]|nr:hemophore-related protein [Mycolicibacterium elephantis]MCV7223704.1 hemophore-related protein [Mycolicibacterium elephantis]
MRSTMKLAFASGGVALMLAGAGVGAGIAAAQPDVDTIVYSKCTYPQVVAALNAESPELANQLVSAPAATGWLQTLIAASPEVRRDMIAQAQATPGAEQFTPIVVRVANTCSNF